MEEDYKQFNPHPLLLDEQLQAHYKRHISSGSTRSAPWMRKK